MSDIRNHEEEIRTKGKNDQAVLDKFSDIMIKFTESQ